MLPEDLLQFLLDFLGPDDVLSLADADLDCDFGAQAAELRILIRNRRAIIKSCPFLDFDDLGAVVAAWLDIDIVVSQQVQLHASGRLRSTFQEGWRLPAPGA